MSQQPHVDDMKDGFDLPLGGSRPGNQADAIADEDDISLSLNDNGFEDGLDDSSTHIYAHMPGGDMILTRDGPIASALRAVEETNDRVTKTYRASFSAYANTIDKPDPTIALFAEVKEIGERFVSKNLASPGNIFLHLLARVSTPQAYIRKRSAPIHRAIEQIEGRMDTAMMEAIADARRASEIWTLHQNAITELTALIDVVRMYGGDINDLILKDGETMELVGARREIASILERIESRIFLLNKDADGIEAHVSRCRDQVNSVRSCREYLAEMQHSIEMICLSANADRRATLLSDIRNSRERLEVMSARVARNAAVSAAYSREQGIISHHGFNKINRIRADQDKTVAAISDRGDKFRAKRREEMAKGYSQGIGRSRDRALERINRQK